ncbi:MAG: hypothetical protein ACKV2U_03285 [Bryobacteraceae bacterium]
MRLSHVYFTTLASMAIAAGQDGLIAVASRTVTIIPTDAVIQTTVRTDGQKSLEDVVTKIKELGIGVENLTTVFSTAAIVSPVPGVPGSAGSNTYTFRLNVPLARATAMLQRVQQFSAANADFRADASVAGAVAGVEAVHEAQRKAFPELFREARARAEEMARDAGLSPGKVLSVSDTYQYASLASIYTTSQIPFTVAVRLAID